MARPIIRTCCCCDLRTGAILIALFSMGIAGINIYTGINAVSVLKDSKPLIKGEGVEHELPIPWKYYDDAINVGWSNVAFFISDVLIGVALLAGALQRHICLLNTWIIWTTTCLLYHLAVSIFFLAIWKGIPTFGYGLVIDLVIEIYFLIVVYSYIQQIKEEQRQVHANLPIQGGVVGVTVPVGHPVGQPAGPYPPVFPPPYAQQGVAYPMAAPPPYSTQAPPSYYSCGELAPEKVKL